jgi:hypothetical protein
LYFFVVLFGTVFQGEALASLYSLAEVVPHLVLGYLGLVGLIL